MSERNMLIVTGGSIDDALVLGLLEKNDYGTVVACDSAVGFFQRNGLFPDVVLGDFDSADAGAVDFFKGKPGVCFEQFPAEKDWTDTELAVRRALGQEPAHIDLVGATGGSRIDHMLGNIQLLALADEAGVQMFLLDTHNRIRLLRAGVTIERKEQYGNFVSLLPFGGTVTGVTLRGMKYPLDQATLTPDITLGISNEIAGETAEISFSSGRLLMIETRD